MLKDDSAIEVALPDGANVPAGCRGRLGLVRVQCAPDQVEALFGVNLFSVNL